MELTDGVEAGLHERLVHRHLPAQQLVHHQPQLLQLAVIVTISAWGMYLTEMVHSLSAQLHQHLKHL